MSALSFPRFLTHALLVAACTSLVPASMVPNEAQAQEGRQEGQQPGTGLAAPRMHYSHPSGRDTKDPSVVRFNGKYFMYHSINKADGSWGIAVASSDNLLDWTHERDIPLAVPQGQTGTAAPGVRVLRGKVYMFFQSYGGSDPSKNNIMVATSEDGLHFDQQRVIGSVVPEGDWNNGRAIDAEGFVFNDQLLMYWATRDPQGRIQMQGVSKAALDADWSDPASWTQVSQDGPLLKPTVPTELDTPNLDLAWETRCIEAATMVEHNGLAYMFYAGGYNNDPQKIGVAVSEDGVNFRRLFNGNPLLGPGGPNAWNGSESGHPGVFKDDDGQVYLFYQGDNRRIDHKWHLSMVPIRWAVDPSGKNVDLPVLDFDAIEAME